VVTEDRNGCTVWQHGHQEHFPAFEVEEVDPTGAGDVFAAAFLLRYGETRDRPTAARFANCVASFAVEGTGTAALPTLEQVEDRLQRGRLRLVPS
jgi:sugar/nucleoside kinase (ribokinase family)